MLTARWWTIGDPPDLAEARCAMCGLALMSVTGDPYIRAPTLPVTTAFPTAADNYDKMTGIWEPSGHTREKRKLHQQRERAKARAGVGPSKRFEPGPRHASTLPLRYMSLDQLSDEERRLGVVGKVELPGRPLYEVPLPANIRCVGCPWINTVNPLSSWP